MSLEDLNLRKILDEGVDSLPQHLEPIARARGFVQRIAKDQVQWYDDDDNIAVLIFVVPDPRDLEAVKRVYVQAQETQCQMVYVLVHQWTDGEGNWDVFTIRPQRRMEHRGRVSGSNEVRERGPQLREDIYNLFQCGQAFPPPGREGWLNLLNESRAAVTSRLAELADSYDCTQESNKEVITWVNSEGDAEAMFFVLPDHTDIAAFMDIYQRIADRRSPVTFVFLKQDEPNVYDIFRLSVQSYLEHHNQVKLTGRC